VRMTIGKDGLSKIWKGKFPETTTCVRCKGEARIGFVALKELDGDEESLSQFVKDLRLGGFRSHDHSSVAVYFCRKCEKASALYD